MTNKSQVKLFVTDMDGTLLGSNKKIPEANLKAIEFLQKKNIPLIICTGRPVFMVRDYIRQTGLTTPVIGCNGALIQNPISGKVLFDTYFSIGTIKKIVDFCLSHELDFLTYDSNNVYFQQYSKRIALFDIYNKIAKKGGSPEIPLKHLNEYYEQIILGVFPIHKVLIAELHSGDLEKSWKFLGNISDVFAVPSMDKVIDLMPAGISKGEAVIKIAEHYGISLENVCVTGDHKNDVSMLKIAGFSACMANGEAEAKQVSNYVTKKTNDEGGFAEAVARFVPQGGLK